jgi:hypothetical protein
MAVHRSPAAFGIAALAFALSVDSASAGVATGDSCDLRFGTVSALFAAANDAAAASDALAGDDAALAATALLESASGLLAERKRVSSLERGALEPSERRSLLRSLRVARKRAAKAARHAAKKPAGDALPAARAAAEAIELALAEQVASHASHGCVGGTLRVPRLFVAADAARTVPAGSSIVADLGVTVLGTLVASGPGGGLTIEAASGDVVLEGTIDARGGGFGAPAGAASSGARTALAARAVPPSCGDGLPLAISALAGDVHFGGTFFALAGDGHDCAPLVVSDASPLPQSQGLPELFRAAQGGDGGNVIVAAPEGEIRFATRRSDDPGPFTPGSGGNGQDVTFADSFVPPSGFPDFIVLGAGSGGDSGFLELSSPNVEENGLRRFYGGGRGGDGGRFEWDLRAGEALFPTGQLGLGVQAGFGGVGTVQGGRGGDLRYQGDRIVNEGEQPVTEVRGRAGLGGNAFSDVPRGPDDEVLGGDGGDADVTGHRGWPGTVAHPDGAPGGTAIATGGDGSLSGMPDHPKSVGGRGGDARARGGAGGDGRPSCSDPPAAGGAGGAGGDVRAEGGAGGDALGGRAGDGGFVLLAETGVPGRGGDGLPVGGCGGIAGSHESIPGNGGTGFILGAQGEAVDAITAGCTDEGGVTCDEVPEQPEPDACTRPRSYSSRVVEFLGDANGTASLTIDNRWEAVEPCSIGSCLSHHTGSATRTQVNGGGTHTQISSFDNESSTFLPGGPHLHYGFIDHCSPSGELHVGGGSGVDDLSDPATGQLHTVTHTCGGFCECGSHWKGCCPCPECRGGWVLDGDGVCD